MSAPPGRPGQPHIDTLDGVRGLAILLVMAGHVAANLPSIGAGLRPYLEAYANASLGVRLFFVLSGYLITSLMLAEQDRSGSVNLPAFYRRRITRIFPAFYVFLGAVLVFEWIRPFGLDRLSFLAAATFTWNYARQFLVPTAATAWILGHLWTLALEQQFYLFWPVFFRGLSRKRALVFAAAIVVWCPLARVASYFLFPAQRGYIGMMFHTASDSLMVGCCAALAVFLYRPFLERHRSRQGVLVAASFLWLVILSPYLSLAIRGFPVAVGFTIDAFACAVLIVHLHLYPSRALATVFGSGLLPKLGLISYSLYLWQQVFLRPDGPLAHGSVTLPVFEAIAVATASYVLVERPILRHFSRRRRSALEAKPLVNPASHTVE